jgi:hypothetical protein
MQTPAQYIRERRIRTGEQISWVRIYRAFDLNTYRLPRIRGECLKLPVQHPLRPELVGLYRCKFLISITNEREFENEEERTSSPQTAGSRWSSHVWITIAVPFLTAY